MRKGIVVFILLLSAAFFALCGFMFYRTYRPMVWERTDRGTPASVDLLPERAGSLSEDVWEGFEKTPVFPKLSGLAVMKINVNTGESVRAGQVLAELDEAPLIADLRRLQEALRQAEKNFREAVGSGDQGEERLRTALDEARGDLADVQMKMGYRYVIAPTSGVLVERNADLGDSSRVDTVMFVIGRPPQSRSGDAAPVSGD